MTTKKAGITSLEEVAQKKMPVNIVTQPRGGASDASTQLVLDAYGMNAEMIKSWGGSVTPTSTNICSGQMQDGKAQIWINMVVAAHPVISELSVLTDLIFLPFPAPILNKMASYGYSKTFLPAKTFKGQDKDVPMPGWPTLLVARNDLPEEVAYLLTKSLVENKPELVKGHAALKNFNIDASAEFRDAGIPIHPGAVRYYKEKGMMK